MMTIREMAECLNARVILGENKLDQTVESAFGSDLMSDVLAFVNDKAVLLTGLVNPHVIRTAEMLDLCCIVFVRGKVPADEIIEMADELGIVVLSTQNTMYNSCGILYSKGLPASARKS